MIRDDYTQIVTQVQELQATGSILYLCFSGTDPFIHHRVLLSACPLREQTLQSYMIRHFLFSLMSCDFTLHVLACRRLENCNISPNPPVYEKESGNRIRIKIQGLRYKMLQFISTSNFRKTGLIERTQSHP